MLHQRIPATYTAALALVRHVFPGALLAGGCLRDLDNGRPVKDVDIFAPDCPRSFEETRALVRQLCPDPQMLGNVMGGYEDWATSECIGVFDILTGDLDFQLICISSGPETILSRMDFGLCRISYDGETVHRTAEYLADQEAHKFTLHRCDDSAQLDRSLRRYDRLSKKYDGWGLDYAEHLKLPCGCPKPEGCFKFH